MRLRRALPLLLPLSLFLAATLFLGGDLGKWNDDYFFFGQFNAATGEPEHYILQRALHFWRPVYRIVAAPLNVALFNHDQLNHIITALVHGLTSALVFLFVRRLGCSPLAAALAAMFFLVYPAHFEVAMWNTVMATSAATALVIAVWLIHLRWLDARSQPHAALRHWWLVLLAGALTFCSVGLNEQPAAAALAMVLLPLFVNRRPDAEEHASTIPPLPIGRRAINMLAAQAPWLAALAALAIYTSVHMRLHPPHFFPTTGGTVRAELLPHRLATLSHAVFDESMLRGMARGMLDSGWRTITAHPAESILLAITFALGAAAFLRRHSSAPNAPEPARPARFRRPALALFALAWYLAAWLPIARIYYPTSPRLHYAPDVGLALLIAVGIDALLAIFRIPARRTIAQRTLVALVLSGLAVFAVMMIGAQRRFQDRWQIDQSVADQLRRLVPDPPEHAVFIPLHIIQPHTPGVSRHIEHHFASPFEEEWAGGNYIRWVYHRPDLWAVVASWPKLPIEPADDDDHFSVASVVAIPWRSPQHPRFAWSGAIPFEVDARGQLHLVTHIIAQRADGSHLEIAPPFTADLARRAAIPERTFDISPPIPPDQPARPSGPTESAHP